MRINHCSFLWRFQPAPENNSLCSLQLPSRTCCCQKKTSTTPVCPGFINNRHVCAKVQASQSHCVGEKTAPSDKNKAPFMGIEASAHTSSLYSRANETVQLEQANPMVNGITLWLCVSLHFALPAWTPINMCNTHELRDPDWAMQMFFPTATHTHGIFFLALSLHSLWLHASTQLEPRDSVAWWPDGWGLWARM